MKNILTNIIIALLLFLPCSNMCAQQEEAENCLIYISYYNEYLRQNNYDDAARCWRKAFEVCPVRIGHKFYLDGATIYRNIALKSSNPSRGLLDTLVLLNTARGLIYPEYLSESSKAVESDINLFASNNAELRNHLWEEIKNVEKFLKESATEGEDIRVAVTHPQVVSGEISPIESALIKGEICQALSRSQKYSAYTRTDIDKLFVEHDFQSTGMVSENERHEIGKMTGADAVCPIQVTKENNSIFIEASLINIKTGEITSSSSAYCAYSSIQDIFALEITSKKVGQELAGNSSYKRLKLIPSSGSMPQNGKSYIETAFGIDMPFAFVKGGVYGEGTEQQEYVEPFYISTLLVTQQQWMNVMGISQEELMDNCKYYENGNSIGSKYPVFCITPNDALDFCKALSKMTNLKYDLPSAVEWEMASNKKSETFYYSGSDNIDDVGWSGKSMPVGLKNPNSYGIYDMSGNVAEFCKYGDSFALKGGKPWGNYRVSTKYTFKNILKDISSPYVGFRVIMRVPSNQ